MTFKEWEVARDNSIKFAQKEIESMKKSIEDSELSKLFGTAYNDTVTDEIREYNKSIMVNLIEEDLYQIAGVLNKIAGTMPKAPEATSRTAKWIEHPHETGPNWEFSRYECSECHVWADDDSDYCPNCGAKMYVEVDKVVDDLMKELAHDDE